MEGDNLLNLEAFSIFPFPNFHNTRNVHTSNFTTVRTDVTTNKWMGPMAKVFMKRLKTIADGRDHGPNIYKDTKP
jgi:hypothetical protein